MYIQYILYFTPLYYTLRTLAELSHQVEFSTKEFSRLQEKLEQNYKRELVEREEALKLHEESLKGSSENYTIHAYVLSMFSSNQLESVHLLQHTYSPTCLVTLKATQNLYSGTSIKGLSQ